MQGGRDRAPSLGSCDRHLFFFFGLCSSDAEVAYLSLKLPRSQPLGKSDTGAEGVPLFQPATGAESGCLKRQT